MEMIGKVTENRLYPRRDKSTSLPGNSAILKIKGQLSAFPFVNPFQVRKRNPHEANAHA